MRVAGRSRCSVWEGAARLTAMTLRTVRAERYVGPLREGGSLPLLVRADDGGCYVVKMRGAGQGSLALVAEVIAGEVLRRIGLRVPEMVLMELDLLFGRQEHDAEIRDLLRASTGLNAGLGWMGGATTFDPAAGDQVDAVTASRLVWGDAFVMNVDRTPRNPNLMQWRGETWLIDHGAALYFQHDWATAEAKVLSPFRPIAQHVLLPWVTAAAMAEARAWARTRLDETVLREIVGMVPEAWFHEEAGAERYVDFLARRLDGAEVFEAEVSRARTL